MFYVTRDKEVVRPNRNVYDIWAIKPTYNHRFGWEGVGHLIGLCVGEFEKAIDIKLKGGDRSIIKVKKFKAIRVK